MKYFIGAAVLALVSGASWLQSRRRVGDRNRALTGAFLGARSTESRFFSQNKRGEFVVWKYMAGALLVASAVVAWIGILSVATS